MLWLEHCSTCALLLALPLRYAFSKHFSISCQQVCVHVHNELVDGLLFCSLIAGQSTYVLLMFLFIDH